MSKTTVLLIIAISLGLASRARAFLVPQRKGGRRQPPVEHGIMRVPEGVLSSSSSPTALFGIKSILGKVPVVRTLFAKSPQKRPKVANTILELIGNTPMLRLQKVTDGCLADVICKLESFNPANSVKDRIGLNMIEQAEARGEISPGKTVIVEPTSGNTGIALAMVGAQKGYRVILSMPDTMSIERRVMLLGFGAELHLSPAAKGVAGAIDLAKKLAKKENGVILDQFSNPDNPDIHYKTTGPEIWKDTNGKVDILVGGVGTGGTLTGCGRFLKPWKPSLKIVAVEPTESAVLSGGPPGPHKIQGIGTGTIPVNADTTLFDEIEQVSSEESMEMARKLATEEGLFVGISSGAAVVAAIRVASKPENKGKTLVVIIPSFGERYLSTPLFKSSWDEAVAIKADE